MRHSFHFPVFSTDEAVRENHSLSFWDLITVMKWSYSAVKDENFTRSSGWKRFPRGTCHTFVSSGSLLAVHYDFLCHAQCLDFVDICVVRCSDLKKLMEKLKTCSYLVNRIHRLNKGP